MKKKQLLSLFAAMCIASGSIFFTGCGNAASETAQTAEQTVGDQVLSFVAADKTNWDKKVNLGDYAYTFAVDLAKDNTFVMTATCVGEAEAEQSMMGPGAGGFGGFGESGAADGEEGEPAEGEMPAMEGAPEGEMPAMEGAPEGEMPAMEGAPEGEMPAMEEAPAEAPTEAPVEAEAPKSDEDFSAHSFTIDGTWEYETGWGYTLTFNDAQNTVVTADFDKASSRQYFYYKVSVDGAEPTQVEFQAEDKNFRQEMDANYVIAEERNAKIIFEGSGNTATGNAAKATIYLENDGTAAIISRSGSNTTYATGTWSEDESAHVITLNTDGTEAKSDYCDIAGKEGYRIAYTSASGMGPSTTLSCYAPLASGVKARDYTAADFEGEAILTATCPEADYSVELTEKGYVTVLSEGEAVESGRYTYDEETDTYTIEISTGTFATEKTEDGYTLSADMPLTGMNAMFGGDPEKREFTIQ